MLIERRLGLSTLFEVGSGTVILILSVLLLAPRVLVFVWVCVGGNPFAPRTRRAKHPAELAVEYINPTAIVRTPGDPVPSRGATFRWESLVVCYVCTRWVFMCR